jgi:hypothetical protein
MQAAPDHWRVTQNGHNDNCQRHFQSEERDRFGVPRSELRHVHRLSLRASAVDMTRSPLLRLKEER